MLAFVPPPTRLSGVRRAAASATIAPASCSLEGAWEVIDASQSFPASFRGRAKREPGTHEHRPFTTKRHGFVRLPEPPGFMGSGPGPAARPGMTVALSRPSPVQREHLGGIEQPRWVEHGAHAHLLLQVLRVELERHQVALFDADAVLAREPAADLDAEFEDVLARCFGLLHLAR